MNVQLIIWLGSDSTDLGQYSFSLQVLSGPLLALTQHKNRSSYVKLWEASAVAVLHHDLVLATVG